MDMRLEALSTYPYAGALVRQGSIFLAASAADYTILVRSKKAKPAASPSTNGGGDISERDEPDMPKARRSYKRRAVVAQE